MVVVETKAMEAVAMVVAEVAVTEGISASEFLTHLNHPIHLGVRAWRLQSRKPSISQVLLSRSYATVL